MNHENRRRLLELAQVDRPRWEGDPEEAERVARAVENMLGGADLPEDSELHPRNLAAWVRERGRGRA